MDLKGLLGLGVSPGHAANRGHWDSQGLKGPSEHLAIVGIAGIKGLQGSPVQGERLGRLGLLARLVSPENAANAERPASLGQEGLLEAQGPSVRLELLGLVGL